MDPQPQHHTNPAIRTRMKGAIVKVLRKAKPQGRKHRKGMRGGGYVNLAQTGLKKMFRTEAWRFEPRLDVAAPAPSDAARDPVELVSLALETLAPATYRAGVFGTPVTVTVDDEATADIFRAALARSVEARPTNRLIRVTVRPN
jgi:hypothetical protein